MPRPSDAPAKALAEPSDQHEEAALLKMRADLMAELRQVIEAVIGG
jgi:hypothetical protein